ncbi:phosphonopyruvate decarboxylase [Prosthecochloris sp. CIB 2401]|uniref:phosphonopyruvate decarboxylase n=1 Tax=Prosthecochloris sp. CIB 2401 TaxID=1868325 RepID=UPI00080A9654|nr:phosphonopyruvate decarboxylase [Prosthecochloris sp. CIB 2401]ANT64602.1 Acetolactate synthase isozyme 1 large subunit [Prosthecochloris sp. CIB 2401]
MIDQKKFHDCLRKAGVEFITGVPDSLLNDFCLYVEAELPRERHVIAANEGNAIALAAGHYLATGCVPLVYMQNSGIGNCVNPLLSLTNKEVYGIPMVLLIGWRGDPDVKDHAQHEKQGRVMPALLELLDIPFNVIDKDEEKAFEVIEWAVKRAREQSSPTALLVKKGVLEKGHKKAFVPEDSVYSMSREEAIACVVKCTPKNALFVATTGRATRELHALRDQSGAGHERDFLNLGAMGHALSIANGMALGSKNRHVICLDGDAAVIMHLGSLTTAGMVGYSNLLHVVLNNGVHESVGGQLSAGFNADLTAIAENAGYKTVGRAVKTEVDLKAAMFELLASDGPSFVEVRIRKGIRADLPPLKIIPSELKEMLMKNIR